MGCNKHTCIAIFTSLFYYGFLPSVGFLSAIAGVTVSCYSFKATWFLLTGSFSVSHETLPEAIAVSKLELLIGICFSLAGAGLLALYNVYQAKQLKKRQGFMIPYDPEDMNQTQDMEAAVEMTQDVFEI